MNKTELEALESKGIESVLLEMARGLHGDPGSRMRDEVEAWVRSKQASALFEASSKRDAREEETLSVARQANSLAREANTVARDQVAAAARSARWAKIAAIIAAVAAIVGPIITAWLTRK
jgi:hypothetical protein